MGTTGVAKQRSGAFGRRRALSLGLASAAGLSPLAVGACAIPAPGGSISAAEVYIGLGKARQVAILDASTDRIVGRIPLQRFGERGAPAQIGVGPGGDAAVLPLVSSSPSIALIHQRSSASLESRVFRTGERPTTITRRTSWLRLGQDQERDNPYPLTSPELAQLLTSDARGNAYVVLGDGAAYGETVMAVIDLETGEMRRRLHLAREGEAVFALHAEPDGSRVYAATWRWGNAPFDPAPGSDQRGCLVTIDALTGAVLARASLPPLAAVTDLTMATGPAGSARAGQPCLYAAVQVPGPMRDEAFHLAGERTFSLQALDPEFLDVLATWELDRPTGALAVTPNGESAYLLGSTGISGPLTRELLCLDLGLGYTTRRWPLPDGCFAITLSPVGKLYVADALGDRLWRVDVARNVMLGDIALPGAPLTLATRPA